MASDQLNFVVAAKDHATATLKGVSRELKDMGTHAGGGAGVQQALGSTLATAKPGGRTDTPSAMM
jgi:hypothetical protein